MAARGRSAFVGRVSVVIVCLFGTAVRFPSPHAKRGGEGSGVGGSCAQHARPEQIKRHPTRLASARPPPHARFAKPTLCVGVLSRQDGGRRPPFGGGIRTHACAPAKMLFLITAWTPQLPSTTWVMPKSTAID